MAFTIIKKRFTVDEFAAYVKTITLGRFNPEFVLIHNTASPSLADRPDGLTEAHLDNLYDYYANQQHWSGGPHVFCDDHGIWVFNPLDRAGVHSPSWNWRAWGIEILGDYATESPTTGRGKAAVDNGVKAAAILLGRLGLQVSAQNIRFHYEDPLTTHACPGRLLQKADFLAAVRLEKYTATAPMGWSVVNSAGTVLADSIPEGATGTGLVRKVVEGMGQKLVVDSAGKKIVVPLLPAFVVPNAGAV
jgi:hypothetical protein